MLHKRHQPALIKRYARLVLAMFVLSVLNLSMQLPAHAAMKVQMQQSTMVEMEGCHCPPAVCDSVLALNNQSFDGVVSLPEFTNRSVVLLEMLDQNAGQLNRKQYSKTFFLNVAQVSPPPLLIKTLLLI
ncbi:MAG: hypothetical protein DIZ80_08420 [endosymbiont of Galathealinum brachiosum]|uniref:Uncharacterized protein n=1 Tax=endosymbiont of Galathealinum brachiosum TaxID=2200906 RepID=A0A370DBQ3_9GAMM|nr:MAG: hypothetical protein DIZ80_08420 [endosymbiont of Galathealinum brachiosum]